MLRSVLLTAFFTLLGVISAGAQAAVGFKTTEVFKGSTTIKGHALDYPTTSQPEVTALLVELEPGGESDRHQHPSPPVHLCHRGHVHGGVRRRHAAVFPSRARVSRGREHLA